MASLYSEQQISEWMAVATTERRLAIKEEQKRRIELLKRANKEPRIVLAAIKNNPVRFINDWVWTFDPRNPTDNLPAKIPLHLRPKQEEFVCWVDEMIAGKQNGVIEKTRDEGMTWVIAALFVHHWLFQPGFKAGIGSRKMDLVDRKDDPDSIFEKLRFIIRNLPKWMHPEGYKEREHANFARISNPANGSSIVGEGGDDIGRGGRNTVYFVDEHAKIERAELVEQSLSQNAPTILYGSTPRGVGNLFYIKRNAPGAKIFSFHWRDNPGKNFHVMHEGKLVYPWYEQQKAKFDDVTIAQEVDIDYTASVEGVVIPGAWVQAALKIKLEKGSRNTAGLDVSGEGADKTVYTSRSGPVVKRVKRLVGDSLPSDAKDLALQDDVSIFHYDRLGVGAAISVTLAKLAQEEGFPFQVEGVANSEVPTDTIYPDLNKVKAFERFADYAAELWWRLRLRFKNTWERLNGKAEHPDEDCISLLELQGTPELNILIAQLSQPTYKKVGVSDKIRVDKKGEGSQSPDHAESLMYSYAVPRFNRHRRGPISGKQSNWG
jgi:phage terminase large subunit